MEKIKAIVVEDDALSARRIEDLLSQDPEIMVQGICKDGEEAINRIIRSRPDLIFLDIQLPRADGFDVLRSLPGDYQPVVVFATAYDRYALRAFKHHAIDYLLKPFDDDRFRQALARAKEQTRLKTVAAGGARVRRLLEYLRGERQYLSRLTVKHEDRFKVIPADEIRWIEANGYYMDIHWKDRTFQLRITMKELIRKLDPSQFLRVHRSYIVRLDFIREIQKWFKGDYVILLMNGEKIPISKTYSRRVFRALNME